MAQDERIKSLEKCDCKKSCLVDGKRKEDNERWEDGCNTCICERGEIKCNPKSCIKPLCKNPEFPPDDKCCPRCLSELFLFHYFIILYLLRLAFVLSVYLDLNALYIDVASLWFFKCIFLICGQYQHIERYR